MFSLEVAVVVYRFFGLYKVVSPLGDFYSLTKSIIGENGSSGSGNFLLLADIIAKSSTGY